MKPGGRYERLTELLCARPARCLWQCPGPSLAGGRSRFEAWVIQGRPGIILLQAYADGGVDLYTNEATPGDWDAIATILGPTEDEIRAQRQAAADALIHVQLEDVDGGTWFGTLAELIRDNPDSGEITDGDLRNLEIGQTFAGGGGAAPTWSVTRIPPPADLPPTCQVEVQVDGAVYRATVRGGEAEIYRYQPPAMAHWRRLGAATWNRGLWDQDDHLAAARIGDKALGALEQAIRAAHEARCERAPIGATCAHCGGVHRPGT